MNHLIGCWPSAVYDLSRHHTYGQASWQGAERGMDEPWIEETPLEWANAVEGIPWSKVVNESGRVVGWELRGDCPRCGDKGLNVYQPASVMLDRGRPYRGKVAVFVQCVCEMPHPGRPAGTLGCGQAMSIRFRTEDFSA